MLKDEEKEYLAERFKEIKEDVSLKVFIKEGENEAFNGFTIMLLSEFSEISDKIKPEIIKMPSKEAEKYDVKISPTILIKPDKYKIRFVGAPAGEEARSIVEAIVMAGKNESNLSTFAKQLLSQLKEKREVKVFVTPTCPYCPQQVINAISCAVENKLVSVEIIECMEASKICDEYNVGAVPHTVINGITTSIGAQNPDIFVRDLIELTPYEEKVFEAEETEEFVAEADLIIIGGGPAGLTAGIYAGRAGLDAIIIEKDNLGGLVTLTPQIENYPGFVKIAGKALVEALASHAKQYAHIHVGEETKEIKVGKKIEVYTQQGKYLAKAVIIATGSQHRKLGVKGEDEYYGHGVSYCAVCDGYLFKNKKVAVIGGGNTALTDALYLDSIGADVTIIHRRNEFRAEKYLQDAVEKRGINVIWNSVVEEILGDGKKVNGIIIKNLKTNRKRKILLDGVFIAIGFIPNSKLAKEIGVRCDENGFIIVDENQRTNIPRIYAAGDVTGGRMQIVTAVDEGAKAALSAYEDLEKPYWIAKQKNL